ncbi:MAG: response regulator [Elusimicrobia bacterium]|nr:response regulator [Elusimicrobiota bacterium]
MSVRKKILHIDDDDSLRMVVAGILDGLGYDSEGAPSVKEGFILARSKRFDLILMDVQMPDEDGYAGCRLFKSDPMLKRLPIIMVTSLDRLPDVNTAFNSGARDYIVKPIQVEILQGKLEKILNVATGPV